MTHYDVEVLAPAEMDRRFYAFVVDRQWQASDPGLGRHYLTVHDSTANIQVSVSTDGEVSPIETPLIYKIRARALRVIVPQSKTGG